MRRLKTNKSKKIGGGIASSVRKFAHWVSNTTPKPISDKQRKRINKTRRYARTKSLEKKAKKEKKIKKEASNYNRTPQYY
jgi:hypothetical protein